MNALNKFLLSAAAVLTITSCSDDVIKSTSGQDILDPDATTPGVYIGVNFQMPSMGSTRSTTTDPNGDGESTSNDGVEIGKDYENNVNEVLLILARQDDYGFIGAAKVLNDYIYKHTDSNSSTGTAGSYHASARFEKSNLEEYYNDPNSYYKDDNDNDVFKSKIAVFVIVNPNGGLQEYFNNLEKPYGNTAWVNQAWEVSASSGERAIWSTANGGSFLMSNSSIAIREIPSDIDAWELFSSRSKAFNLSEKNDVEGDKYDIDNSSTVPTRGAVSVQRACARFDFKDGSIKDGTEDTPNDNTYHALYLQTPEGTDDLSKPFIDVQMQRLSLVNMNNTFYYLERVSNNGLPTNTSENDYVLCGAEKRWYQNIGANNNGLFNPEGGNYVVDFYADQKLTFIQNQMKDFKSSKFFEYPLFEDDGSINSVDLGSQSRWASSDISDILKNETDNRNNDYHIWRYVTENIIPYAASPYEYYQPNGLTTGIVFRAKMIANKDLLVENPTKNEDIERNHIINAINSTELEVEGFSGQDGITEENFSWKNPILYSYAKNLYASWSDLCTAAIEASLEFKMENGDLVPDWNRNNSLYMAVFGDGVTGCTIMYDTEATDNESKFNVYLPGEELPNAAKYKMFNDFTIPEGTISSELEGEDYLKAISEIPYTDRGLNVESANYAWLKWDAARRPSNVGNNSDITAEFKKAVTEAEITIYQRSNEDGEYGYYCYYYYWNRHNDNNRDGVMGPMEFCTVRNNVYKLSVTKVSRLGHPRLDENDPETPKPEDPDESSDVYITVDSKVIPWVVRVNEIEF